jgi:hypothetical protein
MVPAVRGSEYASTGLPSKASPGTPTFLPEVMFDAALTAAKNNAGVRSPISATNSTLSGEPIQSTSAVGASWQRSLSLEPTTLGPPLTSIRSGITASPSTAGASQKQGGNGPVMLPLGPTSIWSGGTVSANEAKGPAKKDPDEPPKGSSAAQEAIFYANRALAYFQNANVVLSNALDLNKDVEGEAAVASERGKTPAQIDAALTAGNNGVQTALQGAGVARASAYEAFDDAANAVAAQNDDDGVQAALDAEAAGAAMVQARAGNEAAVVGWGDVLSAMVSLTPSV